MIDLRKGPSGPTADLDTNDIANDSTVPGASLTDALDALLGSSLLPQAGNTILANPLPGIGIPVPFTIGTNGVFGRVAGNIVSAPIVTAQMGANQVTNAVQAQMAPNTVKLNATAFAANAQDFSVGTNGVLGRVAGNIVSAPIVDAQVSASAAIALTKLAPQAGNSLVANALFGTAVPAAFPIAQHAVTARVGADLVPQPFLNLTGPGLHYSLGQLQVSQLSIDTTANVPVLAAGALGFVDINVAATLVEPLAIGDFVTVLPLADCPPFTYRVSAANTVRLGFQGAISAIASAPFRIFRDLSKASSVYPSNVASAWLNADVATISAGGIAGVSNLPDVITVNPATQVTAAQQPALDVSANGLPILTYAGGQSLSWPLAASNNSTTTLGFMVWVRPLDIIAGNRQFLCLYDETSGGSVKVFEMKMSGSAFIVTVYDPVTPGQVGRTATVAGVLAANVWRCISFEFDSAGPTEADRCSLFVNGVKQVAVFASIAGGAAMTTLRAATGSMRVGTLNPPNTQAYLGSMGPNFYAFNSKMGAATQGLLTTAARSALMAFEAPT